MTITIAGKNPYVNSIINAFSTYGIESTVVNQPEGLKKLPPDSPVLLLENSVLDPFLTDDSYSDKIVSRFPPLEPIVFIADRVNETPDYIYRVLLSKAVKLAVVKRNIIIFGKSIRGAKPGVEKLYSTARNLGVTFIKYDHIEITGNNDLHTINASEGTMEVSVTSPLIIDTSLKEDTTLGSYAKALQIRISGSNKWFIPNAHTSRKNVFFLNTDTLMSERLDDVILKIAYEIHGLSNGTGVFARVNAQKCAFCYTCFRACPHFALTPDKNAAAMFVSETLCDGCGICSSVCPANAIEMVGTSDLTYDTGKLLMLCCENSGKVAADLLDLNEHIHIKSVSCGGALKPESIISALGKYEHILVVVCAEDACRHFDGNHRARLQTERARKAVEKLNINPARIGFVQISPSSPGILKDAVSELLNTGRSVI